MEKSQRKILLERNDKQGAFRALFVTEDKGTRMIDMERFHSRKLEP